MKSLLLALGLLAPPLPAAAQDASVPAGCELHVWPSEGLRQVRQHALGNDPRGTSQPGLIPGALDRAHAASNERQDDRARETLVSEPVLPLSSTSQVELLTALPLANMLTLDGYRTVVHPAPLDSRTLRTVKTRYVESAAPCYADLVVDDVFYSREYANGRKLRTFFRFRNFADQAAPVRSFGTWVETRLQVFSIDPPDMSPPAVDEIVSAFRTNTTAFSAMVAREP